MLKYYIVLSSKGSIANDNYVAKSDFKVFLKSYVILPGCFVQPKLQMVSNIAWKMYVVQPLFQTLLVSIMLFTKWLSSYYTSEDNCSIRGLESIAF